VDFSSRRRATRQEPRDAVGRQITGRLRAFLDFATEEIPRLLEEK
jgi:hypothetical protein